MEVIEGTVYESTFVMDVRDIAKQRPFLSRCVHDKAIQMDLNMSS